MATDLSEDQAEYARLLARIALRDRQAFAALYTKVARKLNAVALALLGTKDLAEEALQEAFVQIWNNAGNYQVQSGLALPWMRAIVRYRALDLISKRKRYAETPMEEEPASDLNEVEQIHHRQALGLCLGDLDNSTREAIIGAYIYGYSREEIAERQKSPINTVKSWLKRGLQRLEECLRRNVT
ncbi:MAG: RNA polymerase sigma-70 factor (ECF subfamily) [Oleiphilaceae bacterium]|jgi:RNA polymerase sigma-70 factor (ECF subfamily)